MAYLAYTFLFALLATLTTARPKIDARIAGGYPARDGQFPWAVALFLNLTETNELTLCSGSLISPYYVLTAAHCLTVAQEVGLVLGNPVLNVTSPYEIRLTVNSSHFIIPEKYEQGVFDWDLALIRIPGPLDLNEHVQTVKLAEGDYTYAGEIGVITGWGTTYQGQTFIEQHLRFVENVVLSNNQCKRDNPTYLQFLLASHLCQSTMAGRGVCHGDSGGALVIDGEAVGIVSAGAANCFREIPTIYTRITSFRNWIKLQSGV